MTTQQATQGEQLALFDAPAPRTAALWETTTVPHRTRRRQEMPETSKEAAALLSPRGIRADWLRLLRYLNAHPCSTDEQLQDGIPLEPNAERPRRGECQANGWLEKADDEGRTKAGRRARRYRVTEAGRAVLDDAARGAA